MKTTPHAISHAWSFSGIVLISSISLAACAHTPALNTSRTTILDPEPAASQPADPTPAASDEPHVVADPPAQAVPIIEPEPVEQERTASLTRATNLDEVVRLYRRLHTELEAERRSGLITELLSDPREPVLNLGFELAHRNLSARAVLSAEVGEITTRLLRNEKPAVRGQAAGLLTRLITPDAMLLLTEALNRETHADAAGPMLLGVSRWPNADATEAVVRWCTYDGKAFEPAMSTAWAFEQAGLIPLQEDRGRVLAALREHDNAGLSLAGMKLLAKFGDADDLKEISTLLSSEDSALRDRVANALVETPRATELLTQEAEADPGLYAPAGESLIRHRATPAGMQRLAGLGAPSDEIRVSTLLRMGSAIEIDALAEGVSISQLDDETAARLLERLLAVRLERSTRMAKGIVMLAEIELRLGHPIQALDIADSLADATMDQVDQAKLEHIHPHAAIRAGVLNHPALAALDVAGWMRLLDETSDPGTRLLISDQVRERFEEQLSDEHRAKLVLGADPEPVDD